MFNKLWQLRSKVFETCKILKHFEMWHVSKRFHESFAHLELCPWSWASGPLACKGSWEGTTDWWSELIAKRSSAKINWTLKRTCWISKEVKGMGRRQVLYWEFPEDIILPPLTSITCSGYFLVKKNLLCLSCDITEMETIWSTLESSERKITLILISIKCIAYSGT